MTVLKTSPINNMSVSAALDPLPFNARLKLYVSFLEKNQPTKLFNFFRKSLRISVHTLFKFDVKQYVLQHGFSCRHHDRPPDRPYKFSLLEYSLIGKFSSTSSLTVSVSLTAHPPHLTANPHLFVFICFPQNLSFYIRLCWNMTPWLSV